MIFFFFFRNRNFLDWLLVSSSHFCLNHPTRGHRENLQHHRLSDNSSLHAGLYVFGPHPLGTLGWTVDRRNLFHLLLVPRWVISVSYTHLRAHETPEHLVC